MNVNRFQIIASSSHPHYRDVAVNSQTAIESYALTVLLRQPALLYLVDKNLESAALSGVGAQDFGYTDHQMLFGIIRRALEQDASRYESFIHDNLPETLSALVEELAAQPALAETNEEKLVKELTLRLIDLRRTRAMADLNERRFLQEDEQQMGGENLQAYRLQSAELMKLVSALDLARKKILQKW